jgi:CBS domain-containing protein
MRVQDIFRPEVVIARAGEGLAVVAQRMVEHHIGALPILDGERIIGVVTERDLTRALAERAGPETVVAWYANPVPRWIGPEDDADGAARLMLELGVRHLPVVRDNRVIGMVSMRDLLALDTWLPAKEAEGGEPR